MTTLLDFKSACEKYPMLELLCQKLELDFDEEETIREAKHNTAVSYAHHYLAEAPKTRKEVYDLLAKKFQDKGATAIINYWLKTEIVSLGINDLLFLGIKIPDEFRIKTPAELKRQALEQQAINEKFKAIKAEQEKKQAEERSSEILQTIFKNGNVPKSDFILMLQYLGIKDVNAQINEWLGHRIIGFTFAYLGTKKHIKTEIVYLGEAPF